MMPCPQRFASQSIEEMSSLLNANIIWPTVITHIVLDGMLKRKRGLILNVSAFSGLYPVPYISAYSSSKVRNFFRKHVFIPNIPFYLTIFTGVYGMLFEVP